MINELKDILNTLAKIWSFPLVHISQDADIYVGNIFLAIILLLIGIRNYKRLKKFVKTAIVDHITTELHTAKVLGRIFEWLISAIYLITILQISNIPLSAFAVISGGIGIGIGLGAKNFFNNFMSSVIVMVERPFKIGDIISIAGVSGVVSSIGGRCITIINENNVKVLIPNSKIIQENLVNWTSATQIIKCRAEVKITKLESDKDNPNYCEDIIKALEKIMKESSLIINTHMPRVFLTNIDSNSYIYQLEFFCSIVDMSSIYMVENDISCSIFKHLKSEFTISYHTVLK
ncbi:mechanosensitive ion channel family protein [Orientia chuto str. Dubai]|uniref:Mechanosensitive ion channel family protein n=1 Tax=Orientia chuto str. Dubai TaxID=1359168 RepID=A0A0F3MS93_9RICK|nr:mechanosensitive ion channel domain-containing protein [Candidatus Orientia mediorientalis]KJV57479.1 mechanosensitive ion channel family protein [Orientia chuto str. Dubai]